MKVTVNVPINNLGRFIPYRSKCGKCESTFNGVQIYLEYTISLRNYFIITN